MGPIQGAPDWQTKFYNTFEKKIKEKDFFNKLNKNIIVACPRRENLDDSEFVYKDQVDWESFYLEKAANNGIIFCWLPKMESDVKGRSYIKFLYISILNINYKEHSFLNLFLVYI